jgi:DNA replication protein DnaC
MNNLANNSLLVMVGDSGCGKTHTAKAIHRFCRLAAMNAFNTRNWGESVIPLSLYLSWPEVASEFNAKNFNVVKNAMEIELLILDDIGAENDPWKICADRLCQIISRRENKFTVITTNIKPSMWADAFDLRIADRLVRNSVVVDLSGVPSYSLR